MGDEKRGTDADILEKPAQRTREPQLYRVILHNDDYTTMEFVVEILETIFHKSPAEAYGIMMKVHVEGRGVAGVYPHEIAETKAEQAHEAARAHGFPLQATLEDAP